MLSRRWRRRAAAGTAGLAACAAVMLGGAAPASADVARDSQQWVLDEMDLPAAWSTTEGLGVTVAVIDSGVQGEVSDLAGSVTTGPDFSGVHTSPLNPHWGEHGTWMAALVAGHGHGIDDGILGSAPQAKVLSIRVITDSDDPSYAQYQAQSAAHGQQELAEAINYAVAHKAGVISMSLGYNLQSRVVRAALQNAYTHDVVVVASAGNSGDAAGASGTGSAPYSFPADYPGVLGVAAVDSEGHVAGFSSENLSVQVAAPGKSVPTQGRDGAYWYVSGTSPACALTAGVAALIKSAHPELTDSQVISAITSSTSPDSRPAGGWDEQVGYGVVNARGALDTAAALAAARPPAAGVTAGSHFGGGPAAVPAAPVAPRSEDPLIDFGLLAAVSLAIAGMAAGALIVAARSRGRSAPLMLAAPGAGGVFAGPAVAVAPGPGYRPARPPYGTPPPYAPPAPPYGAPPPPYGAAPPVPYGVPAPYGYAVAPSYYAPQPPSGPPPPYGQQPWGPYPDGPQPPGAVIRPPGMQPAAGPGYGGRPAPPPAAAPEGGPASGHDRPAP